jgi:hypothetical protein
MTGKDHPGPGVVRVSTCPHCGAPRTCCGGGTAARMAGATGHGAPAEGRRRGRDRPRYRGRARGSGLAFCRFRGRTRRALSPSPPIADSEAPLGCEGQPKAVAAISAAILAPASRALRDDACKCHGIGATAQRADEVASVSEERGRRRRSAHERPHAPLQTVAFRNNTNSVPQLLHRCVTLRSLPTAATSPTSASCSRSQAGHARGSRVSDTGGNG